jgi:hypothetical protein
LLPHHSLLRQVGLSFHLQVTFVLLLLLVLSFSSTQATSAVDVFWIDRYGNISWEDEKARLDNFCDSVAERTNRNPAVTTFLWFANRF